MDWNTLIGILPADRDNLCAALIHAGYAVQLRKVKEGGKTVTLVDYGKKVNDG